MHHPSHDNSRCDRARPESTMTYFLPSFLQKRLVRYALSRLEILETDDLALDKLDIAWGRKSTFELRDVRLSLKVGGENLFLNELVLKILEVVGCRLTIHLPRNSPLY